MKRLKNYKKTVCGIENKYFTILKNYDNNTYNYYLNTFNKKFWRSRLIFKGKKTNLLNKYTLPILMIIYNFLMFVGIIPFSVFVLPFIFYFNGCRNFVRNGALCDNVRFFNWANVAIIIILTCLLILI